MLIAALRRPVLTLAILGAAGVLVVGLSSAGLLPSSIQARLTDFTQQFQSFDVRGIGITSDNYAVVERLAHWQAAQNMILGRPYTGVGFGNYEAAYDQYRTYAWPLALGHAHNYLLNIWAETGLFGFLAYLALWGSAIVVSLRIAWRKTTDDGHAPRSTLHAPRSTLHTSRSSLLAPRSTLHASRFTFAVCLAIGLLGAWVHLSVHNLFDNLFVANTYLLIGVYLGLLEAIRQSPISNLQSPISQSMNTETFDAYLTPTSRTPARRLQGFPAPAQRRRHRAGHRRDGCTRRPPAGHPWRGREDRAD